MSERRQRTQQQPDETTVTLEQRRFVLTDLPPATDGGARVVLLGGEQAGRYWALGRRATVGRSAHADISIEDSLVSREHAVVSRDEAGWMVRDLGSRNGTYLNERRIDVERLAFGDRLTIGGSILLFTQIDPAHERLLERQKIEALGRLSAGIAHDLNNYLGAVLGALDHLDGVPRDHALGEGDVRECLDDIRAATRRGAELTQRLLAFARRGGGEPEPVDVAELCEQAVSLARRTFDRSVRTELATLPGLVVRGDRSRLHQVLMNLLVNARDAMPRGGGVRVKTSLLPGAADASRIVIEVSDEGHGMDDATRARAFEPFFTSKPATQGSGLGLAIAMDIVSAHGGTIECESEVGHGTTVRVVLPASEAESPRPDTKTPHRSQTVPRSAIDVGAVLLVDDEPMVRRAMRRLLEGSGHRVIEASDGRQAVDIVERQGREIGAIIMDLDMPELDGESATVEVLAMDPGMPVVVLSGLCDAARQRRLEEIGAKAVLQKPCDAATLRRTVQNALQQRTHARLA